MMSVRDIERAMRLSVWDGMLFALMVGCGESYFLANAVRLRASAAELALVVTLPLAVGAAGSVVALRLLARLSARKPLVAAGCLGQSLALLGIGLLDGFGALTPSRLIAAVCVYHGFGQAAGVSWSSWFGDLVPRDRRGRYFARRNRFVHLATCAGLIVGGVVLQLLEPAAGPAAGAAAGGAGFRVLLGLAAAVRLGSATLQLATPEPPFRGLSGPQQVARFLRTGRGASASRILVLSGVMQTAVYIASPFFTPYMLGPLGLSYAEYMLATVIVVLAKFTTLPLWGRVVDHYGPRPVYALAAFLVALIPLPWMLGRGLAGAICAQSLSGFSWAGYEVAHLSLLLDSSFPKTRPALFTAMNVAHGGGQLTGSLLGAALAALPGGFLLVFAVSSLARVAVAASVPKLLPEPPGPRAVGRRDLMLRMIGVRAHGGVVHRPIGRGEEASRNDTGG